MTEGVRGPVGEDCPLLLDIPPEGVEIVVGDDEPAEFLVLAGNLGSAAGVLEKIWRGHKRVEVVEALAE